MTTFTSLLASRTAWVEPASLPKYGDASGIGGNAPEIAKQLTNNVLGAYGGGTPGGPSYELGRAIRIAELNVEKVGDRWDAVAIAEVTVSEGMLNGAGVVHGGVMCFIIDNCASLPLVALGVVRKTNGVGVSQSLNVLFHAPATQGLCIRVESTAVTLGARVMSSRCQVTDKASGRVIATAVLSKMQPVPTRL